MLSKQSPFRQVTGKAIVQIAFRWTGVCSWEQDHGKGWKSVAGLGASRTAPIHPCWILPIKYHFLIWGEGDKQEGGRQAVSGRMDKGGGGENDSARMQLLCALTW